MAALFGRLFPALARPASRREELANYCKNPLVIKLALIVTKARY